MDKLTDLTDEGQKIAGWYGKLSTAYTILDTVRKPDSSGVRVTYAKDSLEILPEYRETVPLKVRKQLNPTDPDFNELEKKCRKELKIKK